MNISKKEPSSTQVCGVNRSCPASLPYCINNNWCRGWLGRMPDIIDNYNNITCEGKDSLYCYRIGIKEICSDTL